MPAPKVRRAEFLMALAYATDLATGQSRDFAMRSCVLAMRIAEAAGLDERQRRAVYHQALLRYIGCNADTHLLASTVGDEIAFRQDLARIDLGDHAELVETIACALRRALPDASPADVAAAVERGVGEALQASVPILAGHCEVAQRIAERLGLPDEVRESLGQLYERWDGRGLPRGLRGEAVTLPVRLVTLAQDAIILNEAHGPKRMAEMIAKRRDGAYEAALANVFLARAESLMQGLEAAADPKTILALEPHPHALLDEGACDAAYLAIADMIDMRMPATFGHSRSVAALAEAAGRRQNLPASDIRDLRWSAYAHDLGELAVPVSTWMKAGPLTARETDAARLHPYHGERALASLGEDGRAVAALVLRHHERPRRHRLPSRRQGGRPVAARRSSRCRRSLRDRHVGEVPPRSLERSGRRRKTARRGEGGKALPPGGRSGPRLGRPAGAKGRRRARPRPDGARDRGLAADAAGHTAREAARLLDIAPKTADNHIQNLLFQDLRLHTRGRRALRAGAWAGGFA